jgi:hypothetical protein
MERVNSRQFIGIVTPHCVITMLNLEVVPVRRL